MKILLTALIGLFLTHCASNQNGNQQTENNQKQTEEVSPIPLLEKKTVKILMPKNLSNDKSKIKISIGTDMMVDCNNYSIMGELIKGKSKNSYIFKTDGETLTSLMACLDSKKTKEFVYSIDEVLPYKAGESYSIEIPANYKVKYQILAVEDKVELKEGLKLERPYNEINAEGGKIVAARLPKIENEKDYSVQVVIEKYVDSKCDIANTNNEIEKVIIEGWGYNYIKFKNLSISRNCDQGDNKQKLVALGDIDWYNPRSPLVAKLKNNERAFYQTWKAQEVKWAK